MDGLRFYNNDIVRMPGSSVGTIAIDAGSDNHVVNNVWWDNVANTFSPLLCLLCPLWFSGSG